MNDKWNRNTILIAIAIIIGHIISALIISACLTKEISELSNSLVAVLFQRL